MPLASFLNVVDAYEYISGVYEVMTGETGAYEIDPAFGFEIGDVILSVIWE